MRKLQYVFMTLAVLCFAVPAFAQSGGGSASLVPIGAGIGMGIAAGLVRTRPGQSSRFGRRSARSQSWSARRHLHIPGARPGAHRVAYAVHPGHRLHRREGEVATAGARQKARPDSAGPFLFKFSLSRRCGIDYVAAQHPNRLRVSQPHRHGYKVRFVFLRFENFGFEQNAPCHAHLKMRDSPLVAGHVWPVQSRSSPPCSAGPGFPIRNRHPVPGDLRAAPRDSAPH